MNNSNGFNNKSSKSKASLIQMYSKRLETDSVKIVEHNDNLSNIEYMEKIQDFSKNGQIYFFEEKGSEYDSIEFSSGINLYFITLNSLEYYCSNKINCT